MQAELVAGFLYGLGRDHHAGTVGELRDQRRVGGLQDKLDSQGIDDIDMVERGSSGLRNEVGIVKWRSSENFAASASSGSPSWNFTPGRSLIVISLPSAEVSCRQRQLRHDVELLVDIEQLVAKRRKHDTPDISAPERGVEHVRIFGKADAQGGLGMNASRER